MELSAVPTNDYGKAATLQVEAVTAAIELQILVMVSLSNHDVALRQAQGDKGELWR